MNFQHVTLDIMLNDYVINILHNCKGSYMYYWKNGESELHEIVELDLIRGRFITANQDFSEFDWELENSRIFRRRIENI